MSVVPVYVIAGQSNAKRVELPQAVTSALTDLGGPSVVIREGSKAASLAVSGSEFDWNPASQGELFDQLAGRIHATLDSIVANGDTPVINGFFWIQGERDAETIQDASAYEANLRDFISAIRSEFGPSFPFVISEIRTTADAWPYHELVRQAQHDIANGQDVLLLETDNFPLSSDQVHYSVQGRHALGQALVDTIADSHLALVTPDTIGVVSKDFAGGGHIYGTLGDDVLDGRDGLDELFGGAGDDILLGGAAADVIYGGLDNDTLHGQAGNDFLVGGIGADRLFGGERDDALVGGAGADRFFFSAKDGPDSHDTIIDFEVGLDKLVLKGLAVTSISDTDAGALIQFSSGASVILENVAAGALTPGTILTHGDVIA